MISLLRLVWDPQDPTKVSSEENDVEVFYTDEDFKQLPTTDINTASTDYQGTIWARRFWKSLS
jgi:hypothetical protein